jgi:hypothetical protein
MEDPVYSYCHRYLIAALVIDERQKGKNPPNEFPLYTVQCTQEPRGMTLRNHTNSVP